MILSDEQRMLGDMVGPFLTAEAPVSHLRALRDGADPVGYDRDLWRRFAGMGLSGILVPEAHGGTALGHVEAGIVLAEVGRNLTPSPFLLTGVGAAIALAHASPALQQRWLPAIASGEVVAAIALEESPRHRPERIGLTATKRGEDHVLNGTKHFVAQAQGADLILVVARTSGAAQDPSGLTIFAVAPAADGLAVESERLVDSSLAARLTFTDFVCGPDQLVGEVDAGDVVLKPLLAALRTGAAAELLGLAARAFAITLDYLRDRTQFDRPIGSFQALQHRAANLHVELELARAALLKAQQAIDAGDPGAASAAMVAKAIAGSASALAVQEGVQMHGGVGMTDAFDIGLYMKRQRVLAEMFGDTDYHVDRLARLNGY
jgi:alkylation response protein AidB-like acyl-CoA dehydrogenase